MDKVQKQNSFNTNTPSSESYTNYVINLLLHVTERLSALLILSLVVMNCLFNCSIIVTFYLNFHSAGLPFRQP
jgi:hypothetical protein